MTIMQISNRIEIAFWAAVIPYMTDSPRLQLALIQAHRVLQILLELPFAIKVLGVALGAFTLGFVIGLASFLVF